MKKNILFILSGYHHGGTNKSLQNMLSLLDNESYNFFLFTTNKDDYYKDVFNTYNIIKCPSFLFHYCNSSNLTFKLLRYINRFFFNKIYNNLIKKTVQEIEKKYIFDKVVAFEEGYPKNIAKYFKCKKIAWIHCDYKLYNNMFSPNLKKEYEDYSKFDNIICVSKVATKSFNSFFPQLSHKVDYIYNLLDIETIQKLSKFKIDFEDVNCFKIISIGRLVPVKQFEIIPKIVNEILRINNHIKFKWYIIGDGESSTKEKIFLEIKKYNVENFVFCLGSKDNPYPYIKSSHLLVSTSFSESCPYVINESIILGIPVVVSNFESAFELVKHENGIISAVKDMPALLFKIISNTNGMYDDMKDKASSVTYDNSHIINKLNLLFNI